MHIMMQNNDVDILFQMSTNQPYYKSQKIHKNAIKCYLYNRSWVFEFSHKLYLAQNLQLR